MDNRHLVSDERLDTGSLILTILDDFYLDLYAAGWIFDGPTKRWRYFVSTRVLRTHGREWMYDYLSRMFRFSPLPDGVSLSDVFVISPEYEMILFGDVNRSDIVTFSKTLSFATFTVSDGFVVFLRRVPVEERIRDRHPGRSFARKIRRLEAAEGTGPGSPETPQ